MRISRGIFFCLIVASITLSVDATKVTSSKKISKKSTQSTYSVQDEQQERPLNTTESSVIHQQTLPDSTPAEEEGDASPPTSDTEDSHPVFFKLLDEDERSPSSKSGDAGRSKFPRVYYGEVEEDKRDTKDPREVSPGVKGKRYEYTHSREPSVSVDHSSPHERHEEEYGIAGHRETEGYHGGRYEDDFAPYPYRGYQGHHYGPPAFGYHPAAEAIGKALKVLIPSALVLTGVSALFPNRVKVPTNDYVNINQHQRNKRSLDFEGRSSDADDYLRAEHRSAAESNEEQLGTYDYNIGRYGEYLPSENSNEFFGSNPEFKSWGLKSSGGFPTMNEHKDEQSQPFMSRPSTPQEYDNFNFSPQVYNFIVPESTYQPAGEIKAEPTEHVPTTAASTTDEKPSNKISTGGKMKRKRRPVNRPSPSVASTAASPAIIEEIEKIAPYKKMPTEPSKVSSTPDSSFANDLSKANEKLEEVLNNLQSLQAMGTEASLMFKKKPVDISADKKEDSVDLSPDGPVMGLITSYATHDKDSPTCQKRALCDLAMRGKNNGASRFESFLWNLATLVPEQFSKMYELEDIFKAIKEGDCKVFDCATPNLDIQL